MDSCRYTPKYHDSRITTSSLAIQGANIKAINPGRKDRVNSREAEDPNILSSIACFLAPRAKSFIAQENLISPTAPLTMNFLVGDHVEVGGYAAIVRFVGQTSFAPGDWIGVELETPQGKNDGSVQGERYFNCPPQRGMFVRPSIPRLIERPTIAPALHRASITAPTPVSPQIAAPRPLSLRVWPHHRGEG